VDTTRREFIKIAGAVAASVGQPLQAQDVGQTAQMTSPNLEYRSRFFKVKLAPDRPDFISLSVDSLGTNQLDVNVMLPPSPTDVRYHVWRHGDMVEYRVRKEDEKPAWSLAFSENAIVMRSVTAGNRPGEPILLGFDPANTHPTLLGMVTDEGDIRLPALLHFPAHGTFRITGTARDAIAGYDASRDHGDNFVRVTLPPSTWTWHSEIEYRIEVVSIYPGGNGIENDPRYDGYRRDFLSIFQLNPRRRALANNSASDATPITLFEYAMMAEHLPPFAPGLTAFDLVRQTLERYIGGMTGYGMTGYLLPPRVNYDFLDVYPSLLIAAAAYVRTAGDMNWNLRNYSMLKNWADKMIEFDRDGDGLMEYPLSGNSGSWPVELTVRPSNWWDTIGFGHKDAYSNVLAYPALQGMAALAGLAGRDGDAAIYQERAQRLKASYYDAFYNPETGVLAGWRSADGKLHDYYFLFVNGMAVTYGLVTPEQGNRIWDRLLAKMSAVGYSRFDLGLPGNLIPIRREDYVDLNPRYGGPAKEDGSDGFQVFENGGASACFAYFTIQALRLLGRNAQADAILFPILDTFRNGGFQGRGPNGESYDWTDWKGNPNGYEGLLVDNYLTLLAAAPTTQRGSDGAQAHPSFPPRKPAANELRPHSYSATAMKTNLKGST